MMYGFGMIGIVLFWIIVVVGLFLLLAALLKWLWNITMPAVFNLKELAYWQAVRLMLIAAILIGRGYYFRGGG